MRQRPVPPGIVRSLLATAVILPIAICVILAVAALLGEMGEAVERSPLKWVALGVGIFWTIDLICLVIAQGLNSLADDDEEDQ